MIVADNEFGSNLVMGRRPERLNGIHTPAIAAERDDCFLRARKFQTKSAGYANAHRSTTREEILSRCGRRNVMHEIGGGRQLLVEDEGSFGRLSRALPENARRVQWISL